MSQPRPVVNAASIIGALAILLGIVPASLLLFGVEMTTDVLTAYAAVSGGVIAALSRLFGVRAEKEVTPVMSPRDNEGAPFVPIAVDMGDSENI